MADRPPLRRSITTHAIRRAQSLDTAWVYRLVALARSTYRLIGRIVPALHLGWVSQVVQVTLTDGGLWIQGWAYTRGTDFKQSPQIEVWLHRRWAPAIHATVVPVVDPRAAGAARKAEFDYSNTAFEALWDDAALNRLRGSEIRQVRIKVRGGGRRSWGPVRRLNPFGSGAAMSLRRDDDGTLVGPVWDNRRGLLVVRQNPAISAERIEMSGRQLTVQLDTPAASASLVSEAQHHVALHRVSPTTFIGEVPARTETVSEETGRPLPATWGLQATISKRAQPVHMGPAAVEAPVGTPFVRGDARQRLEIVDVPRFVELHTVELESETVLRLEGRMAGGADGVVLSLAGSRSWIPVALVADGEDFIGRAELRVSVWGGPALPPMVGAYGLVAMVEGESSATFVTDALARSMPQTHVATDYRLQFQLDRRDQFRLHVGRPRRDVEFGSYNQAKLQREHNYNAQPREAVFFESFVGRNATCNPRAIDAEVARRYPDLPRFWSVSDLSIAVPAGGIPVVIGTTAWWKARTSARWVVTNEWLRPSFRKQTFQTVLQTWHGSMYKKIGLDRANMTRQHYRLLREERAKWDMFISQNAPGTDIIKGAYEFDDADVIEAGYPRNDELLDVSDERRAAIRERLGVPAGVRLAMYAPTWRAEDLSGEGTDLIDLPQLANDLGDGWMVLLRGHVRTLNHSDAVETVGIIDVGTYPQVSELFLVADVLITDYSSMMFDYSVTGKPMIFFAPDIDEYASNKVRGAYFDLEALAPGPVVRVQSEVRDLMLAEGLGWHHMYAEKYSAWIEMFNHLDDGVAASRATDALFRRATPA